MSKTTKTFYRVVTPSTFGNQTYMANTGKSKPYYARLKK